MERLLDLIYPPICMSCKKIFDYNSKERYICSYCAENFKLEEGEKCIKCGRLSKISGYCTLCYNYSVGNLYSENEFYYTKNYSLFNYNDKTSGTIYNFKYGKKFENVGGFSKLFRDFYNENTEVFSNIDLLLPVPMYYKKERKRGFNQAKILAKEFSKISNVEYDDKSLFRVKNTVVQGSLTPKGRHQNLENAFVVKNNRRIKGKTIMLVDDIYTSGSTIMKCSKALLENGAKEIFSITLAIVEEKEKDNT